MIYSNVSTSQDKIWWRPQHPWNLVVFILLLVVSVNRIQWATHVNNDSTSVTVFLLCVTEATKLLVAENNKYYDYNWYLDTFEMEDRCSWFLDVTAEILSFLAIIIIIIIWNILSGTDWKIQVQLWTLYIKFYSNDEMRPLSSCNKISVWIRQDWQELWQISVLYFTEGEHYSPKKLNALV